MNRQLICVLIASGLASGLVSGCAEIPFESKKIDYKSAGKLPTLDVPPDLLQVNGDDRFIVPDGNTSINKTFSSYAQAKQSTGTINKASSTVLPDVEKVKLMRNGNQRWLRIELPPEQVLPIVKKFWEDLGFIIKLNMPEAGIIETDWAENRAKLPQDMIRASIGKALESLYSTGERDKFRTRLERSSESNSATEIYISHRGMVEVYEGGGDNRRTVWQPRDANAELEAEMINRLMLKFKPEQKKTDITVAKSTEQNMPVAQLNNDKLEVQESFERTWRRVGLALDRVGFTVEDRDRSRGIYYVKYNDLEASSETKDKQGFFSRWFGSSKKDNQINQKITYKIVVAELNQQKSQVFIDPQSLGNDSQNVATSQKILKLILEQLK